jgi:hypothetical protein
MKKTMLFAAAAVLALPLVATASPVKAGKWEVTVEGPGGSHTVTRCVTQEEADHPQAPKMRDDDCKVDSFKVEGNTMSWKVSCAKRGATMEGKTTYSGDTFTGETHMKMGEREMTQHSTGKYLGKCDGTETMPKQ